ncbi:MAG: thiol-disulfide isomerase/thioredoxin [Oceanospirillaceae bacterium]|jgi:thiol-disulfide isomerase/thioredoxin
MHILPKENNHQGESILLQVARKSKILIVKLFLIAFSLNSFFALAQSSSQNTLLSPPDSQQLENAVNFKLLDLQNNTYQLAYFKGKTLIVNFWASWCGPCRTEIPAMNRAWAELKDKNVAMLAINYGEDKDSVAAFIKDYPIDFTVLLDENNVTSQDWKIMAMPTTIIVNSKGQVIERILGPREWDSEEMLKAIKSIR